jgi:hypothetical protein
MDGGRFDHLIRSLSSGASRRILLAGLTGGLLPLLARSEHAAVKKKRKKKKRSASAVPPPPLPPLTPACVPDCVGRVCGPNSCGAGSCGDCGPCKNCQGGACINKVNGTACGGVCEECQGGQCVPKENGTDCGGNRHCDEGQCVCDPASRICGSICCPLGLVCGNPETQKCVHPQGACPTGANTCVTGSADDECGADDECFCYQTFAGETRCGLQVTPNGTCICTSDGPCIAQFGATAFCAKDNGGAFCAGCSADVGFCAVPCAT